MPQTSFAVGYLQQYMPSDGLYWQPSQASGWFFLHHSVLGTPFQSCERASGPPTRAAGADSGRAGQGCLGHWVSVLLHRREAAGPCLWQQEIPPVSLA